MLPYEGLSGGLIFGKVDNNDFCCQIKRLWSMPRGGEFGRGWQLAKRSARAAKGWLRAVAIQFLILVVALGVAEIVLRVIDLRYLRTYRLGAERVYNYDAELGWFPAPNSDVTFTGIRTIRAHHNSLGLRDIEHDTTPRPTIAFLGDSFVWGYDAEEDERFTEALRSKMPQHRIVNGGVTAYGTDQEYLLLRLPILLEAFPGKS